MTATLATATTETRPEGTVPPVVVTLGADLSPAVRAIEVAYRAIRKRHTDVPEATIVVKRDERAWGHTTVAHVWSPSGLKEADRLEIMISGENLARGGRAVAATLIHEAAHAANLSQGVLDTDVNGRHSRKFADVAEAFGLTVAESGWRGWTDTSLSDEGAASWAHVIETIDKGIAKSATARQPKALTITGKAEPDTEGTEGTGATTTTTLVPPARRRGNRNLVKGVCSCGDSIRASAGVFARCAPTCSVCESPFVPVA